MTKKQKKIYDWLMSKPGYIKKSYFRFVEATPSTLKSTYRDFEIARNQARIDYKKKITTSTKNVTTEVVRDAMKVVSKDVRPPKVVRDGTISVNPRKLLTPGLYFSFGCVHVPFHLERAFNAVDKILQDKKEITVGLILAGDFLDMNSLSSHDRGKKPIPGITLDYEYEEGNKLIDRLTAPLAKNIHKVFIYGNHEDRYFRYMSDIDNSKIGDALPSPETALKLRERGFLVLNDWKRDMIYLGHHLGVCHGEFTNVHTAKKHIDSYRHSVLYYHTHRIQHYIEGKTGGFNGGSMADFTQPAFKYATRAMLDSWLNGFNTIYIDPQGYYHVEQIVCFNNRIVYGGKVYPY